MEKQVLRELLLLNEIISDYVKDSENHYFFGELRYNQICIYKNWHYMISYRGVAIAYRQDKILDIKIDKGTDDNIIRWVENAKHEICDFIAVKALNSSTL